MVEIFIGHVEWSNRKGHVFYFFQELKNNFQNIFQKYFLKDFKNNFKRFQNISKIFFENSWKFSTECELNTRPPDDCFTSTVGCSTN
uniref:Uncharacterized protein n=1 Tax=viral metagenome TaxID=1070528 RepID=A0A6C0IDG9_9ZZZZ